MKHLKLQILPGVLLPFHLVDVLQQAAHACGRRSCQTFRPTKEITNMPTMWFAQGGSRPNSQSGPGIPITREEAQVIVGLHQAIFVGKDAPSIHLSKPSHSLKNVMLEIDTSTEISSLLPEIGFYVVADLTPEQAQRALNTHRG